MLAIILLVTQKLITKDQKMEWTRKGPNAGWYPGGDRIPRSCAREQGACCKGEAGRKARRSLQLQHVLRPKAWAHMSSPIFARVKCCPGAKSYCQPTNEHPQLELGSPQREDSDQRLDFRMRATVPRYSHRSLAANTFNQHPNWKY